MERYNGQEKYIEIIGYVTSIETAFGHYYNNEVIKRIIFNGFTRAGDIISTTADLKIADYIMACKAHREGAETKLTGTIRKEGEKWILSSYSDFTIIE